MTTKVLAMAVVFVVAGCAAEQATTRTSAPVLKKATQDPGVTHHSGETNHVTLSVTIPKASRLGNPIYVDYTLQNDRDIAVVLDHSQYASDIYMSLNTELHEKVPLTEFGNKYDLGVPYEYNRNFPISLPPHASLKWRYNLLDYFKITKGGSYELMVVRPIDGPAEDYATNRGLDDEVDVGPIRFTIKSQ